MYVCRYLSMYVSFSLCLSTYVCIYVHLSFFLVSNDFHYERKNTTMTNLQQTIEPLISMDLKNTTTPNSMPPYTPI